MNGIIWCLVILWLPVLCIFYVFMKMQRGLKKKPEIIGDFNEELTSKKADSTDGKHDCVEPSENPEEAIGDSEDPKSATDHVWNIKEILDVVSLIYAQTKILVEILKPQTPKQRYNARFKNKMYRMRRREWSLAKKAKSSEKDNRRAD